MEEIRSLQVDDFEVELTGDLLNRYLPSERGERFEKLFQSARSEALGLLEPRGIGVTRIFSPDLFDGFSFPQPLQSVDLVTFAVVTIGEGLEERVRSLLEENEMARGTVLDSFGSAAVSEVARKFARRISREVTPSGATTTRAFSPGGGSSSWDIENQQLIFRHVEASRIGVRLTSTCTMKPEKSVSFLLGHGEGVGHTEHFFSCEGCPKTDCSYRYIPS